MKVTAFFEPTDDSFKQFIFVSTVLHLSFLLIVSVKNFLLPSDIIFIPDAIRVDMVALPDKTTDQVMPPPLTANPAPVPLVEKPAPEKKPDSLKKVQDTQKKALEKLKAMAAIEKLENEIKSAAESDKKAPPAKPQAVKGNIVSSGNSFSGISRLKVNEYLEDLKAKVHEHFVLPEFLSNANLKASVLVSVDVRGYVIKNEIYASSGNSIYDTNCLTAVASAAPFLPPPAELQDSVLMIRFPFE